jgi:exodeoxyribonuclease-3
MDAILPVSPLRIFAWNPNGIRALLKNNATESHAGHTHLEQFVREQRPDIVFFPETKGNRKTQFETQCKLERVFKRAAPERKWKWYWSYCDRVGRHGNAVAVSKHIVVEEVRYGLGGSGSMESEGRVIALKIYNSPTWVMGLYVPNAGAKIVRLQHKLQWLHQLQDAMNEMKGSQNENRVIVIGDINVAPDARDLCNPSSNLKTAGYTKDERDAFKRHILDGGKFVDVWRDKHPQLPVKSLKHEGVYSFWSTRSKARQRNAGWRIDLVLMDRESYGVNGEAVTDVMTLPQYYGSDHCPVGVEINTV